MKILFVIPNFCNPQGGGKYGSLGPNIQPRITALNLCVSAIKQLFEAQYIIDISRMQAVKANDQYEYESDIIICTTGSSHILQHLQAKAGSYTHHQTNSEPMLLGFECQKVLRENLGKYDYYCFMEDDLIINDPLFFLKLDWFNSHTQNDVILLPNRYEVSYTEPYKKVYVDGNINPAATARFQNIAENPEIRGSFLGKDIMFNRPLNPHSGCYFLTDSQLQHWVNRPHFLDMDTGFIGPLESAASLGTMVKPLRSINQPFKMLIFLKYNTLGQLFSLRSAKG